MKKIPSITVPIIDGEKTFTINLFELLKDKKVIIFGVPGAFTPTCSEQHLPGFLKLNDQIKNKEIDDIFCISVNDKFVMQSWLSSFVNGDKIKGIADGNAEVSNYLGLTSDKSSNFMGLRCVRFAMIVWDNTIKEIFIEKPGILKVSSAENILSKL